MSGPSVASFVSPTGGTVILKITPSSGVDFVNTEASLVRYANSLTSSAVTLFSGAPLPLVYIDDGEQLPKYLDFATTYFYQYTDPGGTFVTPGIQPSSQLQIFGGYLDKLIFRLFSAGMSSLAVPKEFNAIRVLETMPLSMGSAGTYFPFVVMNLDLEQQEAMQIGQDVEFYETNVNIMPLLVFRRYSMSILSHNAYERNFYKDAAIVVFQTMMIALHSIGQNVEYSFEVSQNQVSDGVESPGFYEAVLMFDFTGQFNVSFYTNYPIIRSITPVVSATTYTPSGIYTVFTI
jgi:hypothetical protein